MYAQVKQDLIEYVTKSRKSKKIRKNRKSRKIRKSRKKLLSNIKNLSTVELWNNLVPQKRPEFSLNPRM